MPEDTKEQASPETSTQDNSPSFEEAASQAYDEVVQASEPESKTDPAETDTREAKAQPAKEATPTWDTVDPRLRTEYETIQKRYRDIQSYDKKRENEWKAKEQSFTEYQKAKQQLDYFSKVYDSNPAVKAAFEKALGIPQQNQIDPDLEQDPLYQHISRRDQELMQRLQRAEEFVSKAEAREAKQAEEAQAQAIEKQVDAVTEAATKKFEELLGRKPTDQEVGKIYQHMVERKVYDGEAAMLSVFYSDIMNAKVQAALGEQMKKKAVGTRVSSVNSGKAKAIGDYDSMSTRDLVEESLSEMGLI